MTEPRSPFLRPDWIPAVPPGLRILITGATGGLGRGLVTMLRQGSDCVIGAHGASQGLDPAPGLIPIRRAFTGEADCRAVVEDFAEAAGGIDALVVLSGAIHYTGHWKDITEEQWRHEQAINLDQPFFLARAAMARMTTQGSGGRILLTGTESAIHGGSPTSFPYAVAKRGTECMVQGLAREGAAQSVLVNGLRFGFIESGFHQRWHNRTTAQMDERAALVPLRRGGHVDEAAALMIWLLSGWSSFMTGQMIPLTGGDWL
jgi:3-oxoacyl-[acyl-carrier protein] reductase